MRIDLPVIVFFVLLWIIFYSFGVHLQGFLLQHAGWGGPHMLSIALNMFETPYFTKADYLFSSGNIHIYNHNPSLFFLVLGFFTHMFDALQHKLVFAYLLSATMWAVGITSIFALLRYFKIFWVINLMVMLSILFSSFTLQYTYLIDPVVFNMLFSSLFIYTTYTYMKGYNSIKPLYIVSIVAVLVSWYIVFIIFCFGTIYILKYVFQHSIKNIHKDPIFRWCLVLGAITILQFLLLSVQASFISLSSFLDNFKRLLGTNVIDHMANASITWNHIKLAFQHKMSLSHYYLNQFTIVMLGAIGVAILSNVGIKVGAKLLSSPPIVQTLARFFTQFCGIVHRTKSTNMPLFFDKHMLLILFSIFMGTMLFYILLYRWTNTHPWVFVLMVPVLSLLFAFAMEYLKMIFAEFTNIKIAQGIFIVIGFGFMFTLQSPYNRLKKQYMAYKQEADKTLVLIQAITEISENKRYALEIVKNKNQCVSNGAYRFLQASPNRYYVRPAKEYQHLKLDCERIDGKISFKLENLTTGISQMYGGWAVADMSIKMLNKSVSLHKNVFHISYIPSTRTLYYSKENCTTGDTKFPFYLHVIPKNISDIPDQRRKHGFDNLDRDWTGVTTRNAQCIMSVPLPAYPIKHIRTGQWDKKDKLWRSGIIILTP